MDAVRSSCVDIRMKNSALCLLFLFCAALASAQHEYAPYEIMVKYDEVNFSINNTISVRLGDRWGIVNEEDEIILPFNYDFIGDVVEVGWLFSSYNENIVTVKLGNKWGILNRTNGATVSPIEYDTIGYFNGVGDLASAKLSNKWGFIDKAGHRVIPFIYDSVGYFCTPGESGYACDHAPVKQNGKWGYIDYTGNIITSVVYDAVHEYTRYGLTKVQKDGKWGFVKDGKEMTALKYDELVDDCNRYYAKTCYYCFNFQVR